MNEVVLEQIIMKSYLKNWEFNLPSALRGHFNRWIRYHHNTPYSIAANPAL